MISTPAPPQPTDPNVTAAAQAGMNRDTAQAQQGTNMINQVTPQGTLTYNPTGTNYSYKDSKGKTIEIPQYQSTTTYSPEQQAIYDTSTATQQKIGQIGLDQAGKIGDVLGTPVDLNSAVEDRLYEFATQRIDPRFAQEDEKLRTRLANQGIGAGSAAYNDAMTQFGQTKNDAYTQAALQARGQSVQEILAQRNQIVNETNALMSGSQVSQPNFINTPQTPVAGVDYVGAVNNADNMRMQGWQAQNQQRNSAMGGIFGMIGSGISMFSDRRLKSNIKHIGEWKNGLNLYEYDIFGNREVGFMADEVAERFPHAVGERDGYLTVNYSIAMEAV